MIDRDSVMTEEQEKAVDQMMSASLARVIDFVKFGEAKNAALLTFASAWILAAANLGGNVGMRAHEEVRAALSWGTPFLCVAVLLAIVSFLPQISLKAFLKGAANPRSNLLFFADLGLLSPGSGADRLMDRYLAAVDSGRRFTHDYYCDLGCQIVVNGRIAAWKYRLFRWGVRALGVGLAIYAYNALRLVVFG